MKTLIAIIAIIASLALDHASAQGLFSPAVTLTPAEQTAQQLTRSMDAEIQRRVMFRQQAWRSVWENSRATPQLIFAALGTNAVKALTASTVDAEWFIALSVATGKPVTDFIEAKYLSVKTGWTITPNQNGSVTVTAPAPAP